jgi:hypothetical protein
MRPLALAALPLALACTVAMGQSTSEPPRCDIQPASLPPEHPEDCPMGDFQLVEEPGIAELTWVAENDPIAIRPLCTPSEGGGVCEAWPQEYLTLGKLGYVWQIQTPSATESTSGNNPVAVFTCEPLQPVTATLTVINGTYEATQSVTFVCGSPSE